MFKNFNKTENVNKTDILKKQFVTNPINLKNIGAGFDNINQKLDTLIASCDPDIKSKGISEIVDSISSLSEQEILLLMSSNNEVIRSIAAKAYVDKAPVNLFYDLKNMLKDENKYLRESAVISLCYLNSVDTLKLLVRATKDNCSSIKLKALTGIADIAATYSNQQAKDILQQFLTDENSEIREFVSDELSILG